MLSPGYRWEELWGGQGLYLVNVLPYPYRCAYWAPMPGGGGILLHWGMQDCLPKQRILATSEGAIRFAEAWAIKWDEKIREHVRNKGVGDPWSQPSTVSAEELAASASRDRARSSGRRWKEKTDHPKAQ